MQVQSLFITATGTNEGKTHTTIKLIEQHNFNEVP